jgi:guanosine-3',5'-bis(diphosphate) 3'-pyrophosphohydrolase
MKKIAQIDYLSNNISSDTSLFELERLNMYAIAASYAAQRHTGQCRKNPEKSAYIEHPLRVAARLVENGVTDLDTLIGAVTHDVPEDTIKKDETIEQVFAEIRQKFSEKAELIVRQVTDNKSLSKVDRKKAQVEHVKDPEMLLEAKLIKLSDKYDNLHDIQTNPPVGWSTEEKIGYAWWAYAVVRELRGLNEGFDKLFDELFTKIGIVNPTDLEIKIQLDAYYAYIEKKEAAAKAKVSAAKAAL